VAGGAAEKITPSIDRARNVAVRGVKSTSQGWQTTLGRFDPLRYQLREGAAQARMRMAVPVVIPPTKSNRGPMLIGLLAAGAAVGAAGAMTMRRRRAANQWEDYEPLGELGTEYDIDEMRKRRASSAKAKVSQSVASVADTVASQAGKVAESLRSASPASDTGARTQTPDTTMGSMTETATGGLSDIATEPIDPTMRDRPA